MSYDVEISKSKLTFIIISITLLHRPKSTALDYACNWRMQKALSTKVVETNWKNDFSFANGLWSLTYTVKTLGLRKLRNLTVFMSSQSPTVFSGFFSYNINFRFILKILSWHLPILWFNCGSHLYPRYFQFGRFPQIVYKLFSCYRLVYFRQTFKNIYS